jgi:hypothetical protein
VKFSTQVVAALCVVLLLAGNAFAQAEAEPLPTPVRDGVKASIDRGIGYLRWSQTEDGNWNGDIHLTGLALRAFTDSHRGYIEADGPFIRRPVAYLQASADDIGAFVPGETGRIPDVAGVRMGLRPLVDDSEHALLGPDGTAYLMMGLVSDEQYKVPANVFDIAHLLLGMDGEDAVTQSNVSNIALRALSQLQDMTGAWGFVPEAGSSQVSADATAMGVLALVLAGVDGSDVRVKNAMNWIGQDYDLQGAFDSDRFYHYAFGLANSLYRLGIHRIEDADGDAHLWRTELSEILNDAQQYDGHWTNESSATESDPVLASVLAIHSLELIYNNPVE